MSITYPSCGSATQSTKEQMNLQEIGEVLGVSESQVYQLHSLAVVRLYTVG